MPGIIRYLQVESGLDGFIVLTGGAGISATLLGVPLAWRYGIAELFAIKEKWQAMVIGLLLYVPFVFAARFTTATYVQLVMLCVPFLTAFLARWLLNQAIPPFTIPGKL